LPFARRGALGELLPHGFDRLLTAAGRAENHRQPWIIFCPRCDIDHRETYMTLSRHEYTCFAWPPRIKYRKLLSEHERRLVTERLQNLGRRFPEHISADDYMLVTPVLAVPQTDARPVQGHLALAPITPEEEFPRV